MFRRFSPIGILLFLSVTGCAFAHVSSCVGARVDYFSKTPVHGPDELKKTKLFTWWGDADLKHLQVRGVRAPLITLAQENVDARAAVKRITLSGWGTTVTIATAPGGSETTATRSERPLPAVAQRQISAPTNK